MEKRRLYCTVYTTLPVEELPLRRLGDSIAEMGSTKHVAFLCLVLTAIIPCPFDTDSVIGQWENEWRNNSFAVGFAHLYYDGILLNRCEVCYRKF